MLAFIRGTLHSTTETTVLVEAGGLGYELFLPSNVFPSLPSTGEETFFHLSFVIRENAQTLYGFTDLQQKQLFEVLLGISGVGPKTALQLVGTLTPAALHDAVSNGDIALVCKVPGIGKKTAQRLMLEIKDKIPAFSHRDEEGGGNEAPAGNSRLTRDAMSALINLGYTQATSQTALQQALKEDPDPANLPALITGALKFV